MENKINLYRYACRLTSIKRFAALKLDRDYSAASHSYRVAILAMMIADDYNQTKPAVLINTEEVLRKALLHDLEEAFIGDIPTPAKKMLKEFNDMYDVLAEKVMKEEILPNCPNPDYYFDLWKNQKDGETGEIIKLADTLEALCTTFYELKRGNIVVAKANQKFIDWFKSDKGVELTQKYPLAKKMFEGHIYEADFQIIKVIKKVDDEEAA